MEVSAYLLTLRGGIAAGEGVPDWFCESADLAELGAKTGIDAAGLANTIERWNRNVAAGSDPEFGRASSAYDGYWGDDRATTLAGKTLYLGGQTALDADLRIVPGGIVEQIRQAYGNVLTTLREAGGVPEDLVSITIYLTDIPDYQAHGREIGKVWRELAGPVYPAMAGIGCTSLWQPEALIEILGVAVIPDLRLAHPASGSRETPA